MLAEIASNYKTLLQNIPALIDVSGYKNDYICRKIEMKPATFSARKHKNNWSVEEVIKILSVIQNEDVEDFLLLQLMKETKNDETISADEFRKEIASWK